MVVHFSLSKHKLSIAVSVRYRMSMFLFLASGLKSAISCSIQSFNATFSIFSVLCFTSILRTSKTMFNNFFIRSDCLQMFCMVSYLQSSEVSDSNNCFKGACIRVKGVRSS